MERQMLELLPARDPHSNKGTYGRALIVAGSENMAGAAYLCAYAAYRAGAGLVRILTPECNRMILQTLLPEAVLTTFETETPCSRTLQEAMEWSTVVAIGPGLGRKMWAAKATGRLFRDYHKPLVADADALNYLAGSGLFDERHEGPLIVTPHVGEYARLTGLSVWEIKGRISEEAARFAKEHGCVCVLKDAPTAVGMEDGSFWINTTGNDGMSTGGSGDVLTGILTGLLAQGMKPGEAARLGVWLHGRAGDLAARKEGHYGLMARHLIEYLPQAMRMEEET